MNEQTIKSMNNRYYFIFGLSLNFFALYTLLFIAIVEKSFNLPTLLLFLYLPVGFILFNKFYKKTEEVTIGNWISTILLLSFTVTLGIISLVLQFKLGQVDLAPETNVTFMQPNPFIFNFNIISLVIIAMLSLLIGYVIDRVKKVKNPSRVYFFQLKYLIIASAFVWVTFLIIMLFLGLYSVLTGW